MTNGLDCEHYFWNLLRTCSLVVSSLVRNCGHSSCSAIPNTNVFRFLLKFRYQKHVSRNTGELVSTVWTCLYVDKHGLTVHFIQRPWARKCRANSKFLKILEKKNPFPTMFIMSHVVSVKTKKSILRRT